MADGLFFIGHALSPLHAGAGQSLGKVDLPIERERHTTFPCVFATGLKGALRKYCEGEKIFDVDAKKNEEEVKKIFGDENNTAGAGGAIFTDFKILLFPVRSSKGAFKWVTCDFVLKRFKRDLEISGTNIQEWHLDLSEAEVVQNTTYNPQDHILLEDYMFNVQTEDNGNFLNQSEFPVKDIYKINDDLFKHLVNNATQIIARNVLNENKTSENLWYEETLPAETVLYSFIKPSFANGQDLSKIQNLDNHIVQIGGNETVGYGLTKIKFLS
ncbi:type III-B CRISPR module RAMP protein Cmr4 [Caldithrix abyssi]